MLYCEEVIFFFLFFITDVKNETKQQNKVLYAKEETETIHFTQNGPVTNYE